MFYCEPCAERQEWPETMTQSWGKCEVCGESARCNDRASGLLPSREPQPTDGPDYHAEHSFWRASGGRVPRMSEAEMEATLNALLGRP